MTRLHFSTLVATTLIAAMAVVNSPLDTANNLTDASVLNAQFAAMQKGALDTPIRQLKTQPFVLSVDQQLDALDADHLRVMQTANALDYFSGVGGPEAKLHSLDAGEFSNEIEPLSKQIKQQPLAKSAKTKVKPHSDFDEEADFDMSVNDKADLIDQVLSERPHDALNTGRLLAAEPIHGAKLSSPFGYRHLGGREFHPGIDLAAPIGTPIYATGAGTVIFAGWMRGYGRLVQIDHGQGMITRYGHSSVLYVAKGDHVNLGDKIAAVGCSGRCTGPHLHYEVRKDGHLMNPAIYIAMAKE